MVYMNKEAVALFAVNNAHKNIIKETNYEKGYNCRRIRLFSSWPFTAF